MRIKAIVSFCCRANLFSHRLPHDSENMLQLPPASGGTRLDLAPWLADNMPQTQISLPDARHVVVQPARKQSGGSLAREGTCVGCKIAVLAKSRSVHTILCRRGPRSGHTQCTLIVHRTAALSLAVSHRPYRYWYWTVQLYQQGALHLY